MLRQNSSSSCINWQFLLVGLFFIIMQCDARAVNVSNTWTMPQEGLNVFYRFFRDRISWFEADAVCQFHHANLVTVDNSFQFDATRDLLRELDVNDIVWIGLMRPQSSDRFMWSSNSRPLVADTGYWAESLPLMDAPLCAVIDPIRDYRWHALRCGGPETASFLCEMPVPSWADACNLKDMPNLTLQYMADTASIELIRNCQEEGLLRTMCRGKQDRERAMQDLICPRERLEAQRINDITNSHFKSLQIINSIPSDNNENNDIELLPMEVNYGPHYPSEELQTEKNTVQRLIEQFNVDELMQADEPSNMETVSSFYKIPGLIPKPVKKSAKKVLDYPKKDNGKLKANMEQSQKDKKRLPLEMEDMMMGDQPLQGEPEIPEQILNEDVSNEILEPLPHIKKTNIHKEDGMEKMEKEAIAIKKSMQKSKEMESKKLLMMSTTTTTTTTTTAEPTTTTKEPETTVTSTTEQQHLTTTSLPSETHKTEVLSKSSDDNTHKKHQEYHQVEDNTGATTSSSAISHPMHPQQPRSNVLSEESQHSHTKESVDSSHFIPPMLMVKSHYVPPSNKHEHHHQHHQQLQQQHTEDQLHVESTTEREHDKQNQTSPIMTVTTPKVLDLDTTTLKALDSSTTENDQQQHLEQQITTEARQKEQTVIATLTTTENERSSINPITEKGQDVEHTTEKEQRKNSKNLHFGETTTTITATTLQTQDSTTNKQTPDVVAATTQDPFKTTVQETQTVLSTNSEEINKNNESHKQTDNESQELKPSQTTDSETQTTGTTNQDETTEKSLKPMELAEGSVEKHQDSLDIATTSSRHQEVTTEENPITLAKNKESKEHLKTMETTQTVAATTTATDETVEALTTTLKAAETITNEKQEQQEITTTTIKSEIKATPSTTVTENLQPKDKVEEVMKEKEEKPEQDKTETIVKATEILETSSISYSDVATETTTGKIQEATEKIQELEESREESTQSTTIKPNTITLPQNEVTTETSVSSTNSQHITTTSSASSSTTMNVPTTSTTLPPTTTTIATSTTKLTEIEIETTTENNNEFSTVTTTTESSPSTPPETTHNFLKVTTEMPFKPNRRRSLTKPETVSYMKKILG